MRQLRVKSCAVILLVTALAGCSRSPEARRDKFVAAGKQFLEKKDYTRAVLQLKSAIKAVPQDPEPYYQLALAYLGAGDLRLALFSLRKVVELNPKHIPAQVKMAELMAGTRDPELLNEAEKRLHAVLDQSPVNEDALNILAVTEWSMGRRSDAAQHMMQALASFPEDFKAALGLVQVKLLSQDFKGAEELLKKFCADNPKAVQPALALAELYILLGKVDDAEHQLAHVSEMDPKNGLALMDLGGLKLRAGKKDDAERIYRQVSALPDRQFKPIHAIFLFQSGKVDEAIAEFDKLSKEDPADRNARSRLVQAYYNVNRKSDAEKVLTAALQKNQQDIDALLQRSRIRLDDGKYPEADADLVRVLRFKPDAPEPHYLRATIYEKTGARMQQRQELIEAVRLAPEFLSGRLELAGQLLETANPKAARDVLNEAAPSQKEALPVILLRNWANLALGDIGEFQKGVVQASGMAKTPDVLLQEAELKVIQHDHPGAQQLLDEVLRQAPEDIRAMELMMRSYAAQKRPLSAAVGRMREHSQQHPGSAGASYFLGKLLMASGDRAGARQVFETAKRADPGFIKADEKLAQLDLEDRKLDDARKRLLGLVAGKPSRETELSVHMQLVALEEQAEDYPAAIQHCRRVLKLDPDNFKAMNDLAFLLTDDSNQLDDALKLAQRAKEIAPNNPDAADTLGWVLYRKGLYAAAVTQFEHVASGGGPVQKCHLALAYFKLGKQREGQRALDTALKLDPNLSRTKIYQEAVAEAKKVQG
jgi:tetratricopeptide (TPR) repeat protein